MFKLNSLKNDPSNKRARNRFVTGFLFFKPSILIVALHSSVIDVTYSSAWAVNCGLAGVIFTHLTQAELPVSVRPLAVDPKNIFCSQHLWFKSTRLLVEVDSLAKKLQPKQNKKQNLNITQ